MKMILGFCLGLLLAPLAQAQYIDCAGGCSETLYGLGNDSPTGPFDNTYLVLRPAPGDGSCGPDILLPKQGQIRIRDQDSCVASSTTRCEVEVPQVANDSGYINASQATFFDLGPLGIITSSSGSFRDFGGNLGFRQLAATCGVSGDDCALDSECDAQNPGDVCRSTCVGSGDACASEDDAACPGLCRTEIEWDGIGLCSDQATRCSTDDDCSGEDVCFAGFFLGTSEESCICCQSTTGNTCPVFGNVEYPALRCGTNTEPRLNHINAPDWVFEGARGTSFAMETIQVPGQQEGVCNTNRFRVCGTKGDFWAGAANGKCESGTAGCAGDPFGDDLALASDCDDVAFGGTAGDFCDLTENFLRGGGFGPDLNPDGSQNPASCVLGGFRIVGTPNELCALGVDIGQGDPRPGCLLANVGVQTRPDVDCNGVSDTLEGRCMPEGGAICSEPGLCPPCSDDGDCASNTCINNGDLCPFIGEVNWFRDLNNDGIGDECQCGDGNGDGAITGVDISAVAVCANGLAQCDASIVDATGDIATTAEDIAGVVQAVNGVIPTSDLICLRNFDSSE